MSGRIDADHPYASDAWMSLALALSARGAHHSAAVMAEDALARSRRHLGDRHPDTLRTMASLAHVKLAAGDWAGSQEWFRRALEGQRAVLPSGHPAAAETLAGLGVALLADGQADTAEPLLREAWALPRSGFCPGTSSGRRRPLPSAAYLAPRAIRGRGATARRGLRGPPGVARLRSRVHHRRGTGWCACTELGPPVGCRPLPRTVVRGSTGHASATRQLT